MRESGILLHITSLPGPYGIGTMGKQAFAFVDFLQEAGQRYWQILPLNPTGFGDSPYQSCSAYAGNSYLIDLCLLVEEGLLKYDEFDSVPWKNTDERVDFGLQYEHRSKILRIAYGRFRRNAEYDRFCEENKQWLTDYALYMALKELYHGKPWYQWDDPIKYRESSAIEKAKQELTEQMDFYRFVQFLFFRQWNNLHDYARERNVRIIGDVPIYVPYDSVDVWSTPEWFQLDDCLNPAAVAGCPPDAFSQDGQLWGNPLYLWDELQKDGYRWWINRLCAASKLYDVIRLDHFRGFEAYWSVPFGDETARNGHWVKGPGLDFINAIRKKLPHVPMIAEDLGFLTEEVLELRDQSGFPGMKVLEFAFESREPSLYLPHTYPVQSVCYTGTHDNMTLRQWLENLSPDALDYATEYMALTQQEGMTRGVIRTALSSVSKLCVIPVQDWLDLGAEARMNFPGTMTGANWTWRMKDGLLSADLAKQIYNLTRLYGRCGMD